jgi:GTP-binding protein HflX
VVALVGYTNAGKSTLFNRLTAADVLSKDMLFATLDTTMRAAQLPDGKSFILSDTVGFVANLPTQLVAAFRGTLEEVLEADLVLHVRDVSHSESEHQAENVKGILADLGLGSKFDTPIIEVWNKFDRVPADIRASIEAQSRTSDGGILVSATTGQGVDTLLQAIASALSETEIEETIDLGISDGQSRAWLFQHARVISEETVGESTRLRISWTLQEKNRFANSGLG